MKKILRVGGSVRDHLLGLEPKDKDYVAVGYTSEDLLKFPGAKQIGKSFPVFLIPGYGEVALPRKEKKTGVGHKGFSVQCENVSLEEDLLRRDLTCNAIAMDEETGKIFDPYNGQRDIKEGVLRHVSKAFSEDPLRVYRLARFACKDWVKEIAPSTKRLVREIADSELLSLPVERVVKEFLGAMESSNPENFISLLDELNFLHVHFPELWALKDVPAGPPEHHGEKDAFVHTLMVLKECSKLTKEKSNKAVIRVSALLHDLGKGVTKRSELPRHFGHESAGEKLVSALGERLRLPRVYIQSAKLASKEHLRVHRLSDMSMVKKVDLVHSAQKTSLGVGGLAIVAKADALGRIPSEVREGPDVLLKVEKILENFSTPPIPSSVKGKEIGLWVRMKMGEFVAKWL